MPVSEHDYAVVIGVDHYPGYRHLRGARADAQGFATWLVDTAVGGGLPAANCRLVLSEPDPIRPIQDDIDEAFIALMRQARETGGRRFYLFFSGHGLSPRPTEVCLCLAKWCEELRNAALSLEGYVNGLVNLGRFDEVFAFLDCCRVWHISVDGLPPIWAPAMPLGRGARTFVAYAAEYQRGALEAPDWTLPGRTNSVHGHFSRALLSGLYGAAANSGGGVPPAKLKDYLEFETPRIAMLSGHTQHSVVNNGLEGASPPLGNAVDSCVVRIAFLPARRGEIVLVGPDASEIRRGLAATGPWELRLSYGRHLLEDVHTGDSMTIDPRPHAPGGTIDVSF